MLNTPGKDHQKAIYVQAKLEVSVWYNKREHIQFYIFVSIILGNNDTLLYTLDEYINLKDLKHGKLTLLLC